MLLRILMAVAVAASVGPLATPGFAAKGGQSAGHSQGDAHKSGRGGSSAEHRQDGGNKWGGAKGFYKPRT